MVHPHYASAEVRRDREAARSPRPSSAVAQVTGGPSRDPRARKATRRVPIPPELVAMLRAHLEQFGTGPDGRP
jgi:hypothetical protein